MREPCHRCGGDLPAGDGSTTFCPHCGAPQLYLAESCVAEALPEDAARDPNNSTGASPPPRPRQVEWKPAIVCAGIVAGVAGVLSLVAMRVQMLSGVSTLWTLSGSVITLALYRRRRPLAWMDAGVGTRIGLLVGLSLIACLSLSTVTGGLIARYSLHAMGSFDEQLSQFLQAWIKQVSAATPTPPDALRFFNSSEFRAGFVLASVAFSAFLLLAFSALGGAVGGLLGRRRTAGR